MYGPAISNPYAKYFPAMSEIVPGVIRRIAAMVQRYTAAVANSTVIASTLFGRRLNNLHHRGHRGSQGKPLCSSVSSVAMFSRQIEEQDFRVFGAFDRDLRLLG